MPSLTIEQWVLAIVAAACIGISKSGFSGLGLATVIIMARIFPPRESTGILLPLLVCGDVCAVLGFRRHASWRQIRRVLPPTLLGIGIGFWLMGKIPDARFRLVIGASVLIMSVLQMVRQYRPGWYREAPHTLVFAWTLGLVCGVTTMLANAAGPIMALYLLAIGLPKFEFVGTSAWFFLLANTFKLPFSARLGLIHGSSLEFNLALLPAVVGGAALGRWLIRIVPQKVFETLLLIFTTVMSLQLMGVFDRFPGREGRKEMEREVNLTGRAKSGD